LIAVLDDVIEATKNVSASLHDVEHRSWYTVVLDVLPLLVVDKVNVKVDHVIVRRL